MNCGKKISDMWRYYQRRIKELRGGGSTDTSTVYMDGTSIPDTPERKVFEELGLKRYCCRKHLLTNVDLINK